MSGNTHGILSDVAHRKPGTPRHVTSENPGIRDPRGGARSSARLTAPAVAAGRWRRSGSPSPTGVTVRGYLSQLGPNSRRCAR